MSKNLFYDLPEDIKRNIHKLVYQLEVNTEINEYVRPGDFSFMITSFLITYILYWNSVFFNLRLKFKKCLSMALIEKHFGLF
jgi:hypothetical protein